MVWKSKMDEMMIEDGVKYKSSNRICFFFNIFNGELFWIIKKRTLKPITNDDGVHDWDKKMSKNKKSGIK